MAGKELKMVKKDCPIAIRIGVFFDGTGNNMKNDLPDFDNKRSKELKRQKEALEKKTGVALNSGKYQLQNKDLMKTDLYSDTNITRLYEIYNAKGPDDEDMAFQMVKSIGNYSHKENNSRSQFELFTFKLYERGTGTADGEPNDNIQMATGVGEHQKITDMLKNLNRYLNVYNNHTSIIILDVFGFSRGASNARDFVNRIHHLWKNRNYTIAFLGIFDTVGSFGHPGTCTQPRELTPAGSQTVPKGLKAEYIALKRKGEKIQAEELERKKNNVKTYKAKINGVTDKEKQTKEYQINLQKYEQAVESLNKYKYHIIYRRNQHDLNERYFLHLQNKSANHIVHITALHERREKFNLVSIRNKKYKLATSNYEEIPVIGVHADTGGGYGPKYRKERFEVEFHGKPAGKVFSTQEIDKFKQDAKSKGLEIWYKGIEAGKKHSVSTIYFVYWRTLNYGLSNVYLHLMHQKAIERSVPLLDIEKFVDSDSIRFEIPDELKNYSSYLKSDKNAAKYSKKQYVYDHWVHISSRTDRDFVVPGTSNPILKGTRWDLAWQDDPKASARNTMPVFDTTFGYYQERFDSIPGYVPNFGPQLFKHIYPRRGICDNIIGNAVVPLNNNKITLLSKRKIFSYNRTYEEQKAITESARYKVVTEKGLNANKIKPEN